MGVIRPCVQQQGFTIIELLVVMAIAVMAMAVVGPNLSGGVTSTKFKAAIKDVASGLRYARNQAITQTEEAVFFLDVDEHFYTVTGRKKHYPLPEAVRLVLETAESELEEDGRGGNIRFFPDGSSTGGRIILEANEQKRLVDINWLTGQVVTREDTSD